MDGSFQKKTKKTRNFHVGLGCVFLIQGDTVASFSLSRRNCLTGSLSVDPHFGTNMEVESHGGHPLFVEEDDLPFGTPSMQPSELQGVQPAVWGFNFKLAQNRSNAAF